jgi:hypothetical protein
MPPPVDPSAPAGASGDAVAAVPPEAGAPAPARGRPRDLPTALRTLDVEARPGAEAPVAAGLPSAVSIVPRPAQTLVVVP